MQGGFGGAVGGFPTSGPDAVTIIAGSCCFCQGRLEELCGPACEDIVDFYLGDGVGDGVFVGEQRLGVSRTGLEEEDVDQRVRRKIRVGPTISQPSGSPIQLRK